MVSGSCITFALATQKNGPSEVSGEPWVVSKFWRLERCLSASLSRSQVLTDTIYNRCLRRCDLGTPIYNRYQTQGWGSRKKTSPKIWWIQKVVVPLHSQLQRKGGRKCPIHDWRLVTTKADRYASRANLEACLPSWLEACLIRAFSKQESIGEKKLLQIFGGFKNLSYLCTHNPQEKAVRSSLVEGVLSWSS